MPNDEKRVHVSLYLSPKLKKFIHLEAIKQDTWIQDVVEELLWIALKWAKKAEAVEREQEGQSAAAIQDELKEINTSLDYAQTHKRKRGEGFDKSQ